MKCTLTIDGIALQVDSGQTVLQAAQAAGIYIPTLCDYPGLPSHGSCRMCIVEVQGRSTTPTACTTPVEEGMSVQTNTLRLLDLRGELLRMLLAEHPAGCLFCPENENCEECMVTLRKAGITTGCRTCPADGQCQLQDMVLRSGLGGVAYPVRYRALPLEKQDPFFDRDYNLCVLCGRCIRACETLHFTNIPAYVKRGSETRVGTSFGLSHLEAGCSFCGACVDACPTGALIEKTRKWAGAPTREVITTCPFCSISCEMRLQANEDGIIGALPAQPGQALCVKGRFGIPEMVHHPSRLRQVLRIEDGAAVQESWDSALEEAARQIAACQPADLALVVSASAPLEDLVLARQFSRALGGAPLLLDAAARYGAGLPAVARLLAYSQSLEAIDNADLVFCIGLDAKYAQSVVETRLMRSRERGAQLITLNPHEHVPGRFTSLWLRPLPGQEAAALDRMAADQTVGLPARLSKQLAQARGLLIAARNPLLVVGPDALVRYPEAVERLVERSGAAVAALPSEGNLAGALRLGIGAAQISAQPRVIYCLGASAPQPLPPESFMIFQNTHTPAQSLRQGLLLPAAAFNEREGRLMDQGGRIRTLRTLVRPPGEARSGWQILCLLARALDMPGFDYTSAAEINLEVEMLQPVISEPPAWPSWLAAPGEHDYLGTGLAGWVDGLRALEPFKARSGGEEPHVPLA